MMYLKIGIFVALLAEAHGLQCYTCESIGDQDCDASAEKPGKLDTCPENKQAGCFISEIVTGVDKVVVSKGCTALDREDEYKCEIHRAGTHIFTFCNCHGDECNKDWGSAAGPAIKCYGCNSLAPGDIGNCDDTNPGKSLECPIEKNKGCYISKATYGNESVFERGCTEVSDPAKYVCSDPGSNGHELHYCNCKGEECNKSWDSALAGAVGSGAGAAFSSAFLMCAGLLVLWS